MSGPLRRCVFAISCQLMKRSCSAKLREKVASLGSRTELLGLRWQPTLSQPHKFSHSQTPTVDSTLMEEEEEEDSLFKSIEIEVKGHDPAVLNSYQTYITMAARELDITVSKCWTPPKVIERYTLLKSVHIYKKHRVQYETRTHFKTIQLIHLTGSTASTFLEYIQRNLPEGVAMKVTKHRIERLPDHIREPPIDPQIVDTAS